MRHGMGTCDATAPSESFSITPIKDCIAWMSSFGMLTSALGGTIHWRWWSSIQSSNIIIHPDAGAPRVGGRKNPSQDVFSKGSTWTREMLPSRSKAAKQGNARMRRRAA